MNAELEKRLEDKYPFMKKGKTYEEQKKSGYIDDLYSAFGCECEDGWFSLIDELCADITRVYEEAGIPVDVEVSQIKEKFGTLRFYCVIRGSEAVQDKVQQLIEAIEDKSASICEMCGKPGKGWNDGWIYTLCDECYRAVQEEKSNF